MSTLAQTKQHSSVQIGEELCSQCGQSTARGSGRFVNRVPVAPCASYPFPNALWCCAECDTAHDQRYHISNGNHSDISLWDVMDSENDDAVVIDGVSEDYADAVCDQLNIQHENCAGMFEPVIVTVRGGVAETDSAICVIVDYDNMEVSA